MNKIRFIVMDVDGTLTDGKIYMGQSGEICKAFHIKDGSGIHDILIPNEIIPVIITGRVSDIVKNRCKELGIKEVYQGVNSKVDKLYEILNNYSIKGNIELNEVAYIGDDINDLPVMRLVCENGGIVGCPADSIEEVKNLADFVSSKDGGNGAVREFIEWIMKRDNAVL